MLLSVLDPALLIYSHEHWQARASHCLTRCEALALHRQVMRKYGLKMALSQKFASLVYQSFPCNRDFRGVGQLRDLRRFILDDLEKAVYVDTRVARQATLQPVGIVCQYVEDPEVTGVWNELLCGCVDEALLAEVDLQIATWETSCLCEHPKAMALTIHDSGAGAGTQIYYFPLVWDDDSWAVQLVTQEWWPNLQRCVELCFRTNLGMTRYSGVRQRPIALEYTDGFWKSADRFCRGRHLRRSFIEALTKKVYGILDASLGDESMGDSRRFRVTRFWRVHYREEGDRLVLEEFGPHSIGGLD